MKPDCVDLEHADDCDCNGDRRALEQERAEALRELKVQQERLKRELARLSPRAIWRSIKGLIGVKRV